MLAHKATHEAKVAAEAACGHKVAMEARVIPAVACASGFTESSQCGSLDGAACAWAITCTASLTGNACPVANGCGDTQPDVAPVCADGSEGSLVCLQTTTGCEWGPSCPVAKGNPPPQPVGL